MCDMMTIVHTPPTTRDRHFMRIAERLAWRGSGHVEPNPMVGCVIVSSDGTIVGRGYHRRFGGAHAEVNALREAGERARGATVYVTLEPCAHTGQTPPCTEALINAGVSRVVIDQRDPNPDSHHGIQRLRDADIEVVMLDEGDALPLRAADSFVHRIRTGRPWVIAKWAQTIDGRIATRTGESQWISSPASRRLVHRKRGRVDAIITGIGTVLNDDPRLTARNVRVRRIARRVVIDPQLQTPVKSQLMQTARDVPTTILCYESILNSQNERPQHLQSAGIDLLGIPVSGDDLPLGLALEELTRRHEVATVLIEAGGGLLSRLFAQNLVNEAWVFTAPLLLGDEHAPQAVHSRRVEHLTQRISMQLVSQHARQHDIFARYVVQSPDSRETQRS